MGRPRIVEQYAVTCCVPWCPRCGGWQAKEIHWSDGVWQTVCETCNARIPQWPEGEPADTETDTEVERFDRLIGGSRKRKRAG